jgi:HEAT repeat protein
MRAIGRAVVISAFLLGASAPAFAHGGEYNPGAMKDPGPPLGPPWHPPHMKDNDPELTPGGGDPKVAVTRWETWWANNKDAWMRLAERMGGDAPGATKMTREPSEREKEAASKRAAALRRRLASLFAEALTDPEFEVRTAAAIALGKTGEASGSEALRRAASSKDEHKDVRDSAVLGLGLLGREADIPFLEEMLLDRDELPRRRAFAAFALGLIGGDDAAVPLLRIASSKADSPAAENLKKRPELAASVFVAMGMTASADVLPVLRAASADRDFDENVRAFAFISLGRMKDRGSVGALVATLVSERDPALRRAAAVALGRAAGAEDTVAVATLVAAMRDDKDPVTRHFAATSLGTIRSPVSRDALREGFRKGPDADRSFAALAIAMSRDDEFAPELRAALAERPDESTAGSCCIALGLLGDVASAPAIEKTYAGAKHVWLQGYAALALGLAGSTSSVESLHEKLVAEKDPRLRMNLAVALGMLHDPRARTYLVDTMRGADTFFERGSAALALGALKATSAVGDIEVVYRDTKEKDILRAFAVVALGEIADPSPVPKLTRFAADGNYDAAQKVDPLNEILSIY